MNYVVGDGCVLASGRVQNTAWLTLLFKRLARVVGVAEADLAQVDAPIVHDAGKVKTNSFSTELRHFTLRFPSLPERHWMPVPVGQAHGAFWYEPVDGVQLVVHRLLGFAWHIGVYFRPTHGCDHDESVQHHRLLHELMVHVQPESFRIQVLVPKPEPATAEKAR
jgi:hypothetical protein